MIKKFTSILSFLALVATQVFSQVEGAKGIVAKNAELVKVADGFSFTEGPAVNRMGDIFFTDQPNDKIYKWAAGPNEVSLFMENTGRANGLYFKLDGTLIAAADADNEIWQISRTGEKEKVLVKSFKGEPLNGPNDVWVKPSGGIYFTDPLYARPYWERSKEMLQDGQHVYFLSDDGAQLFRVDETLEKPNGIVGTPDSKTLYVADIGAGKTYKYDIREDGYLLNKELFCEMGSDGMTLDERGNLYLTGDGVTIFNRKGEKVGKINVPSDWTANVVFGALDRKTLFITAKDAVYTIEMKVRGVW
ncbi:SMP-30/gluconolactonase/LRE family protein [Algoriphagus sediminis]|uniref:SMP-30/gluconolactonase/LRE family protein n=1 Tax=Algoriphagus sediminis TaxID=3057113 RepID=A0ABT7YD58_9BACT|nr:SMP-30/gluconolactonase/LRE family protein [Algoriphagus sediminis]MDN3204468.1 SMP-30/gluconolactonase/LRE family protein [Algoriphagus sediminis]